MAKINPQTKHVCVIGAGIVDLGRENRELDANRIAALIQQARDNFPEAGLR